MELSICTSSTVFWTLTCVSDCVSEVVPEDGAERGSVNENRVCGFTASNYPSACCLLGNRTYSFIPFCILEKNKCLLFSWNLSLNRSNLRTNWTHQSLVQEAGLTSCVLTWRSLAQLKEPQSSVLIWWVDGRVREPRTTTEMVFCAAVDHKRSRLPENLWFWLFALDETRWIRFLWSLCENLSHKEFYEHLKNAAAPLGNDEHQGKSSLLIITDNICWSESFAFKNRHIPVDRHDHWCFQTNPPLSRHLVIKPQSCSLSSCSENQGVARHVSVWRIAHCNTVIRVRSPPTRSVVMGPSSQSVAACYYHNPPVCVLSASDLHRHELLPPNSEQ